MLLDLTDTIGLVAACLTTLSFLPQALMVIRTQQTAGISLTMYGMFTVGVALWLVYGIAIGSLPITIANTVTLALASCILVVTARNSLKRRHRLR